MSVFVLCLSGCSESNEPMRGVTLESIEDFPASYEVITDSEETLTVRVVLDAERDLRDYQEVIASLSSVAVVMVQLLDSEELGAVSAEAYAARAAAAVELFGNDVSVWEIGNELNGEWVGDNPEEINRKVLAAYDVIRASGGSSAITLNYWSGPDCYTKPWEATMDYARAMPTELTTVDYIFLSVYETACSPPQQPSANELGATLQQLGEIFPQASLGIGEIGAQGVEDGLATDPNLDQKRDIAQRYYGMHQELQRQLGERFVGGYFWWYFKRDAVDPEEAESLWPKLESVLRFD